MGTFTCGSLLPSCGICLLNTLHFERDLLAETCLRFTNLAHRGKVPINAAKWHTHGTDPVFPAMPSQQVAQVAHVAAGLLHKAHGCVLGCPGPLFLENNKPHNRPHVCLLTLTFDWAQALQVTGTRSGKGRGWGLPGALERPERATRFISKAESQSNRRNNEK